MPTYKISSVRYIDAESIDQAIEQFRQQPLSRSLELQTVTLVKSAATTDKSASSSLLAEAEALVAVAANQIAGAGVTPICAVHTTPMIKRSGKHGDFWSCNQKNADGTWCRWRPPQS